MLIFNLLKLSKLKNFVISKKYFCKNVNGKRDFKFQNKFKSNLNVEEKYNECIRHGLSSYTISTNKWIFNLNIDHLNNGLQLLKKWNPRKMDDLFLLLQMPILKLVYLTKKTILESTIIPQGNRIYYFSEHFEKTPQEVCRNMIRFKFLFSRKFFTLQQIHQILLENNINKNDIWNDIWVFMYSINHINQRIACIKAANVSAKPWMLRCKTEVLERTIKIRKENRVVLNKNSTAQYLAKRLKVSEKTIKYISTKYPTTLRVTPIKLKEILDFLLKEGYKSIHILSVPRVFTHSLSTLQERLTELRDLGCDPTLALLCKNKTTYQELVNKLILKNTKGENNSENI